MSLFDAAERFAALDRSVVMLDEESCLHKRDRFSECEACFEICPVGAITPGKPPALNPEKCESCLACLVICPVGAYSADDVVASLLNAVTHLEGSVLELVCEKNPQAGLGVSEVSTGIRVRGCLAGLGRGAYLALAAFGLEHILVRMDACSTCKWGSLSRQVENQVRQAKQLLEAWGKQETLDYLSNLESPVIRVLWEASNPPLSRRDMFRMVAQQGKVAMARAIEIDRTKPGHRPGRDRTRLLNAVTHLPAMQPGFSGSLAGMDFAEITVSEACTACGVCARACPTHALLFEKEEKDTTFALKISMRKCIGCGMCVHVCAPSAIVLDLAPAFSQIFDEEVVTLQQGELDRCEHCGILMAARPDVHLCHLCEFRRTHPLGSMMPPGFLGIKPTASKGNPE